MLNSQKDIKCPKCGAVSQMTVWESINASEAPDLKADILARKINILECGECSQTALVPTPLLYTDEEKKLMIYFAPSKDAAEKKKLYDELRKNTRNETRSLDGYNMRFVTEYNELMEKILIFDNGFNDKTIEFLKMLILVQEPQKAGHRSAIFGKVENDYIEFMVRDMKENQIYTTNIPMSTYETLKEQLRLSGVKPYSFDWEVVDLNYASALLTGMNNA